MTRERRPIPHRGAAMTRGVAAQPRGLAALAEAGR
jgi:hypothetical protein